MAHHAASAHNGHHAEMHEHHVMDVAVYWKVFLALMFFLILTVAAAIFDLQVIIQKATGLNIRGLNIMIMLTIAVIKATLVVMYFMHVKDGTRLTWIWAAAGFVWLLLMFAMIMSDYIARGEVEQAPPGWEQIH